MISWYSCAFNMVASKSMALPVSRTSLFAGRLGGRLRSATVVVRSVVYHNHSARREVGEELVPGMQLIQASGWASVGKYLSWIL